VVSREKAKFKAFSTSTSLFRPGGLAQCMLGQDPGSVDIEHGGLSACRLLLLLKPEHTKMIESNSLTRTANPPRRTDIYLVVVIVLDPGERSLSIYFTLSFLSFASSSLKSWFLADTPVCDTHSDTAVNQR